MRYLKRLVFDNDCVNKYFKFVGLKLDEFLNWDFQIEHISTKNC